MVLPNATASQQPLKISTTWSCNSHKNSKQQLSYVVKILTSPHQDRLRPSYNSQLRLPLDLVEDWVCNIMLFVSKIWSYPSQQCPAVMATSGATRDPPHMRLPPTPRVSMIWWGNSPTRLKISWRVLLRLIPYLGQHQCRQQFYHLRCAEGCVQALRTLRRGILQSIKLEEMQNMSELTICSQPWTKARHIWRRRSARMVGR